MNYRLIKGSLNDIYNPKKTILLNRGITNFKEYLNLTDSILNHYSLLDNIDKAVECLVKHISNTDEIHIIVDCDADGFCSAAIIYHYLQIFDPNLTLSYSIHSGKEHGLSKDISIPENVKLVIIPDAGTNDNEQCKILQEKGIDIIILDHHQQDKDNQYAIIVNNQTCDYPNKALCGAGIVYKFLQAIDEELWNEGADHFLDLVALGLISDSMDIRSLETKRLINKGLNQIRSKFFKALIDKQSYSINNEITINNIQFYITPLINAMVRAGDYEEKELMFHAFIETDETFKYKPRRKSKDDPEPEEIDEIIYDRVSRLCGNAKNRQNKSKDESIEKICDYVDKHGLNNNKILFVNCTELLDKNLTGVVAMKTANHYGKPCLMLRKTERGTFDGSARNLSSSYIEDLKGFLEATGMFEYCQGHSGAFGLSIKSENIVPTIKLINEKLKDIDCTSYIEVDFILEAEELDTRLIKELNDLKGIYGHGIPESLLVTKNIVVNKNDINIMGKNNDTFSFLLNDEIKFIKFKADKNDVMMTWLNNWEDKADNVIINVIGKCGLNNFRGILNPQVIIMDYERIQ